MHKQVLCLSEAGWRGIRRFSLLLNRLQIPSLVLINARPSHNVRAMVEEMPCVVNFFFPRKVFRIFSYVFLLGRLLTGKVSGIVVEKQKTLRMLSPLASVFRVPLLVLEEIDNGFRLFKDGVEIKNPDTVLESLLS